MSDNDFIKLPNLPSRNVRLVCVSHSNSEVISSLKSLGIDSILIPPCSDIDAPVSSHADMVLFHLGGKDILVYDYSDDLNYNLKQNGFNVIKSDIKLSKQYPHDIAFNCVNINNNLYCKKDYTEQVILSRSNANIFNVKQGYVKCSTCIVDESSIITSDIALKKIYSTQFEHVLLVEKDSILLEGYNYGFIGGCCGKISSDTIAFTGSLDKYSYSDKVKVFLSKRGQKYIELTDSPLTDVGSIIPLKY